MSENMRPGMTMARYWSEVVRLKNTQVAAVEAISEPNECTFLMISVAITFSIPLLSMIPPNAMAATINHIVFSMPAMPPVTSNSFTISLGVTMPTGPYKAIITVLNEL